MVVIEACQCEEGLGLAHSHVEAQILIKHRINGNTFTVPKSALEANPVEMYRILGVEPASIRIWIDWKAVAKAVMSGG